MDQEKVQVAKSVEDDVKHDKGLFLRVGVSSKNNKKYFRIIFICDDGYQISLGYADNDTVHKLLDIGPRVDLSYLDCKDYPVL